jgi:hypothetical protein
VVRLVAARELNNRGGVCLPQLIQANGAHALILKLFKWAQVLVTRISGQRRLHVWLLTGQVKRVKDMKNVHIVVELNLVPQRVLPRIPAMHHPVHAAHRR